jgi:hypothetical protein
MDIAKTRAGFGAEGAFTPDSLHAGDFPIRTAKVTIVTGQNLVRGSVLGKITASGKFNLSASAAGDGSNTPVAILAEDVDATAADKEAVAYITGDFNGRALTLGAGHTLAAVTLSLRDSSIFVADTVDN